MGLKRIILISFVLLAAIISIILFINRPQDMSSFISSGASIENYEQQADVGYITVEFDHFNNNPKKVLKVVDKELQSKLQQINSSDVIGINMAMTIPAKEIKNIHINFDSMNIFDVLYSTDQFDKYITVIDISLK